MPPKASKRTHTESSAEPTPTNEGNKKPRLDLQEQIKRASALAAQLRDGVKDGADSKNSAANQIAAEELMRIFETLPNLSKISSQPKSSARSTAHSTSLGKRIKTNPNNYFYTGLEVCLKPGDPKHSAFIIKAAQEKMEGVTSEDYVAEIKKIVKEVIIDDYMKVSGLALRNVLASHV
ncbi:hypothetical protein KCU77_g10530, partial [Aureobasidium melanogenum]